MPHDTRDLRSDHAAPFASWGGPMSDGQEGVLAEPALWLTGGGALLLWTGLALLLTSA